MAIKVKELNDDAILSIDVNKSFYLMVKNSLHYLFTQIQAENPDSIEKALETIKAGDYSKMSPVEQAFFTNTLMVSEIERVSLDKNLFTEKEILEPTDEGYVEPTLS
jgi:formate dehydrogenase maturation protein FdhE